MARLEYRILGPLEVRSDGRALDLGPAKQRALLAILLVNAGRSVSTDRLIEGLWPDKAPGRPDTAVQTYVSNVRKVLEPGHVRNRAFEVLVTDTTGYVLSIDSGDLDARRFEHLTEEGTSALARGQADAAARKLRAALSLWRGNALEDFVYEPWAQSEASRLEELRLVALEHRIEADLACGRHGAVAGELAALVAEHPLRERLRGLLMLALYRMGRQADALDAYQSARRTFLDELGLELGPELQALNRAVLKQDPSLDAPQAPSAPARRTLRSPPTPLIGRERAVATALTLLRGDVRLLTLTGPGGTGKTRLALALAQALEEELEGGTAFVELAAATDSQTALATVAQALGVEERDDHPLLDAIGDALTGEEVLLVLDNFEQVRDAAPEVARLLASAPRLKVLVTSRATLHLSGEHEFAVPPLDLPDTALAADPGALAQSSAVALFVHRAQAVQPDFVLDAANGPAVAELCHRLDGLPLALELAAARTKLLAPDALLARLTERLDDLGAGAVDLPERQRTLRATIAWSCGLLPEGGRRLFARLGVFAGGCTFDAAEHVCDGDLESIEVLVDNSLVSVHDGRGESRLTMLETIRAFAVEQLETTGEAESMRRRLARYLAEKAARAEAELPGEAQAVWLAQLEADKENVRAALTWALQHEPDTALRIAACLRVFWYLHGYSAEGRRWIEAALAASTSTEPSMRAKALTTLGTFAEHQGDFQQARVLQEEAVALLRDLEEAPALAAALNNLGVVAVQQADYELARVAFEESIEIKRGLDNRRAIAPSLSNLGTVAMKQGDIARARGLHEEAIDLMRELGIAGGVVMANSLSTLAEVALAEENVHEARTLVGEALLVRNELGDKGGAADSLLVLARVEAAYGRLREAERAVQESLALAEELQDKEGLAAALEVASDHVVERDPARAVALRAAASRLRAEIGAPLAVLDRDRGERTLAAARDALGDDLYAGSFAEGEKLSTPQAVELAREPAALVGGD